MAKEKTVEPTLRVIRILGRPESERDVVYPPYQILKKPRPSGPPDRVIFRTVMARKARVEFPSTAVFGVKTVPVDRRVEHPTDPDWITYQSTELEVQREAPLGEVSFQVFCEGSYKEARGNSPPSMIIEDEEP